jgi:hypothetical protein
LRIVIIVDMSGNVADDEEGRTPREDVKFNDET